MAVGDACRTAVKVVLWTVLILVMGGVVLIVALA